MVKVFASNEWEMWKFEFVVHLKLLSQNLPEEAERTLLKIARLRYQT
jgi:hypothetical protein